MNRALRRRRTRVTVAGSLAALLLLAGCGSADRASAALSDASASPSGSPSSTLPSPTPQGKQPVLGSPKPQKWRQVTIDVNAVERDANGMLTVVYTVTNHGSDDFDLQNNDVARNLYTYGGTAGVTIIDRTAKQRYYPDTDNAVPNNCLCLHGTDNDDSGSVPAGGSQTAWDVYSPDPMPGSVEIDIPGYAPLKNIPVSG